MNTIKKIEIKAVRVKVAEDRAFYSKKISCSLDIAKVVGALLGTEDQEVFLAFHLSTKNEVFGYSEIARGGMSSCAIEISVIFRSAIINGANAIIVAHNHPSGKVEPSGEDNIFTKRIKRAGELLGIQLLDHIIVPSALGNEGYFSYLDSGLLNKLEK